MKTRSIAFVVAAFAGLSVAAPFASASKLRVVASIPDLADIARAVGGDEVDAESIAKGAQDPHFVDPKPSLLLRLSRADIFVEVGLELEIGWVPPLLDSARNAAILPGGAGFIDASQGVKILEKPSGAVSRSQGDVHPLGNPHYWLDPENGLAIADTFAAAFSRRRPEAADLFRKNAETWKAMMRGKIAGWRKRMAPFRGREIVTYHRSWTYLTEFFGLQIAAEIEPKPGIPPSPGHTREVIDAIVSKKVGVIIQEPYYAPSEGQAISERTGAAFVVLPSMVGGAPEALSYPDLFETIVVKLLKTFEAPR